MVLDRLSQTHIQIKSTLTISTYWQSWSLILASDSSILFLQHVSQEFIPKIFDTSFEIISVLPRSTSSLLLLAKEMPRLRQERLFLQLFLQLLWLCWFNDGTSIIQIHQDYMANPLNLSVYHPVLDRLSQTHIQIKSTLTISTYWHSWSLILASDSSSFSCSTYCRSSFQKYLTQVLKS